MLGRRAFIGLILSALFVRKIKEPVEFRLNETEVIKGIFLVNDL